MVAAGSIVTVTLSGEVQGVLTATDLQSEVSATLIRAGLPVRSIAIDDGGALDNFLTFRWLHYLYTATVVVEAPGDFESPDDVGGIVQHAFYTATGLYPQSAVSAITTAAAAAAVLPFGTAAPAIDWSKYLPSLQTFADSVHLDVRLIVIGLLALLAVIVFALAPHAGTITKALV